jgi:hypothetical protein
LSNKIHQLKRTARSENHHDISILTSHICFFLTPTAGFEGVAGKRDDLAPSSNHSALHLIPEFSNAGLRRQSDEVISRGSTS